MRRKTLLVAGAAVVVAVAAGGVSAFLSSDSTGGGRPRAAAAAPGRVAAAGAPPVRALLVIGEKRVTLVTLQGRRLRVPLRLQQLPRGVSPDGRFVARATKAAVLIGGVRGGPWRTVLRSTCGDCEPIPSFAWGPGGRLLAVVANQDTGGILRIVDRGGRVVRSFRLLTGSCSPPFRCTSPSGPDPVSHRVVAWRGGRLFLIRNQPSLVKLVALDIRSGASRELGAGCDVSVDAFSPDGRLVAVRGGCLHSGYSSVTDAATGRSVLSCSDDPLRCRGRGAWVPPKGVRSGALVGAPDGTVFRSLVELHGDPVSPASWRTTIDRISRDGKRVVVLGPTTDGLVPLLALPSSLVYGRGSRETGAWTLHLLDLKTGRDRVLLHGPSGGGDVLPLSRLP